jgi:hypothetical protein
MGFNHEACGFSTVGAFVDAMKESEGRQLDAFVSFVIHNKLNQYLRSHNWSKFARGYNGEGYEKNDYDNKMANAWLRYNSLAATASATHESPLVGKTSDSSTGNLTDKADAADSSATETKLTKESGDTKVEVTDKNEQDVNTPAKLTTPDPYLGIGFWAVIKRDMAAAGAGNLSFQGISEYAQQASGWPPWVIGLISKLAVLAVIFTVGWFVFRVIHYAIDTHKKNLQLKLTAEAATSTVRKDIQWQ